MALDMHAVAEDEFALAKRYYPAAGKVGGGYLLTIHISE